MADIKWIKLDVTLPDNRKIKRIRKLPDGDKVILFWVFLLSRAGESNQGGGLFFTDSVPYTEEELAADFDFTIEFVKFALITLEKYRMVERYDHIIFIRNWDEYQQQDKLEKIQEQNRIRQERYRNKQLKIANNNVIDNVTHNVSVTESNATELELELEQDNNSQVEKENIPYADIITYLNDKAERNFKVIDKHKSLIKARWNEGQKLEDFKKVIDVKIKHANDPNNLFDSKYLQPSTLFGNKFDEYLNQYVADRPKKNKETKSWQDAMREEGLI